MNFMGFVTPLKRLSSWLDDAPVPMKLGIVFALFGLLAYPSTIHRLWADATALETKSTFTSLPIPPGTRAGQPTEQMNGLYDPTSTDGTYMLGWFGTSASFEDVVGFYRATMTAQGWVEQPGRTVGLPRLQLRDHPEAGRSHYELLVAQVPSTSREVPAELIGSPTLFAVRLGVIDPRATTQVSWFIDCLVQGAPTFPSCEAVGWNPITKNVAQH
jgi:hypothetical protein